jgi:hypothetical protein
MVTFAILKFRVEIVRILIAPSSKILNTLLKSDIKYFYGYTGGSKKNGNNDPSSVDSIHNAYHVSTETLKKM